MICAGNIKIRLFGMGFMRKKFVCQFRLLMKEFENWGFNDCILGIHGKRIWRVQRDITKLEGEFYIFKE